VPIVLTSPLDSLYAQFPVIIVKRWEEVFVENALGGFQRTIISRFGDNWMQGGNSSSVAAMLEMGYWKKLVQDKKREAISASISKY
jgi:hypothetical protein